MNSETTGKKIRAVTLITLILLAVIFIRFIVGQKISSVSEFQSYICGFGPAAPVVLTLFQAFQVIVPVVPGYLGCFVGAVSFGTMTGFLCNYIGITAGSIAAYFIARKYGLKALLLFFPRKKYEKWSERISRQRSYNIFLFIATLLPLFPDDFLCYFSGLIKMNAKRFIWIIILGKPWCILAYSYAFGLIR